MKSTYEIKQGGILLADASLCKSPREDCWSLSDIEVYEPHKGQGHGRKLLKMVCDDADRSGVTLDLMPAGAGPMSADDLRAWYGRNGFVVVTGNPCILRRVPRIPESAAAVESAHRYGEPSIDAVYMCKQILDKLSARGRRAVLKFLSGLYRKE